MKKRWKKYFSFSTFKTKNFQISYLITMGGLLVSNYYKRGPEYMPDTLKTILYATIAILILSILIDGIKMLKKDRDDND